MTLESKDKFKIGGSPALPVSHGSSVAEPRGCEYRWRGLEGLWRRNLALGDNIGDTAAAEAADRRVRHFPASLLAGEQRSADRAHKGVSGRSKDVTCNMLHACFLKPKKAELAPLIDYARGERLVRVEAEGSDQG